MNAKIDAAVVSLHSELSKGVVNCMKQFEHIPLDRRPDVFAAGIALLVVGFYHHDLDTFFELCSELSEAYEEQPEGMSEH